MEKLSVNSEAAMREEDRLRTHPEEMDEAAVGAVSVLGLKIVNLSAFDRSNVLYQHNYWAHD